MLWTSFAFRRSHNKGYAEVPCRDVVQKAVVSCLSTPFSDIQLPPAAQSQEWTLFQIFIHCFHFHWLLLQPLKILGILSEFQIVTHGVRTLNLWGCGTQYSSFSLSAGWDSAFSTCQWQTGYQWPPCAIRVFGILHPHISLPPPCGRPPISIPQFEDHPKLMVTSILKVA